MVTSGRLHPGVLSAEEKARLRVSRLRGPSAKVRTHLRLEIWQTEISRLLERRIDQESAADGRVQRAADWLFLQSSLFW